MLSHAAARAPTIPCHAMPAMQTTSRRVASQVHQEEPQHVRELYLVCSPLRALLVH